MDRDVDPVVLLGAAALLGGILVVQPWPTLILGLGATWLLRGRVSRKILVVAVLLAVVGALRAWHELREVGARRATAVAALRPPQRCEVVFEVERSPVVLTPRHVAGMLGRRARLDGVVREGWCGADATPLPGSMSLRLYGAPEEATRGARLRAMVDIGVIRRFDNPGSRHPLVVDSLRGVVASGSFLDGEIESAVTSIPALVDRARRHVRGRIEETFAPVVVPHARALVLGEYDLEREEQEAFRLSGLAHLLAVSGTHLVLAVLALGRLLRVLLARIERLARRTDVGRVSASVCIALSWLYADFAGGGGSAYRAAAMLSVGLLARALGRRPSGQRAFGYSLLGAASVEPLAAHDLSFGLSVLATAGIMVWSDPTAAVPTGWRRGWHWLRVAARATVAAHLACLPILLTMSSDVPVLAVAANVLAAPVGELAALPVCLSHALLWWARPVELGAAVLGSGALEVVRAIAHGASGDGLVLDVPPPTAWQLAALAGGGLGLWLARERRAWLIALAAVIGMLELGAVREGRPRDLLRVAALDVGQGDAILVDLPDGRAMLVDGGGLVGSPIDTGERVVLDVLRHRRRERLDVVVLSHPHPDHYGGLLAVLERVPVTELWVSGLASATRPRGPLARAISAAAERGTRVRDARELCGRSQRFGAARVEVLGPCPTFDRSASANDNSLVIRIGLGDRVALLTGDAEAHQEAQLLTVHGDELAADLLKVGHHGSRTSTGAAWLERVSPSVAMISCGVRNRFGHPHRVTLDSLARFDVAVTRTDLGGAVLWRTDGVRHEWRHHRTSWHSVVRGTARSPL